MACHVWPEVHHRRGDIHDACIVAVMACHYALTRFSVFLWIHVADYSARSARRNAESIERISDGAS